MRGTIDFATGYSADAVAFAKSVAENFKRVQWTEATVSSADRALRLRGFDDSADQTWTMEIIGCMACGFNGAGTQSAAEIIAILMPRCGDERQILSRIVDPSSGSTSWQDSQYTITAQY